MSLWNDFWDEVSNAADSVGNTLSNAWDAIKHNPIGAITSAVAMAYGIPPAWAGALGGAANAASQGGNVVKAAITGAAMGQMGYVASDFAGATVSPVFGSTAGAIAAGAAGGAAAGVTGAILTGQNIADAAKAGLVLGSVMAGGQQVYHIMTQGEAIASVPVDTLAKIYASGQDPLGTLIKDMGWTSSDSATAAASKAFSQNAATTQQMLVDYIPNNVLESAQKIAAKGGDSSGYIAKEMGWTPNTATITAANTALSDYTYASTSPAQFESSMKQLQNAGVTEGDARTLLANGYSPNSVNDLITMGYNASDLADIASTGVKSTTLTSLAASNSPFSNQQIGDLLSKGVSANDVGLAGLGIKNNSLDIGKVTQLLENGESGANIYGYNQTKVDSALRAFDAGFDTKTVDALNRGNYNIDGLIKAINNGVITVDDLNANINNGRMGYVAETLANEVKYETKVQADLAAQKQQEALTLQQQQAAAQQKAILDQQAAAAAQEAARVQAIEQAKIVEQQKFDAAMANPDVAKNNFIENHAPLNDPIALKQWQQENNISDLDVKIANAYNEQQTQQILAQQQAQQQAQQNQPVQPEQPTQTTQQEVTQPVTPAQVTEGTATGILKSSNMLGNLDWTGEHDGSYADPQNNGYWKYSGDGKYEFYKEAPQQVAQQPVQPPNTVDVGNGNFMDQQGNIVDSTGKITQAAVTPSAPISQTATGYTPEQEAKYNQLISSGMTPADAVNQIENGMTTSDTIPVTGSAGLKGNESVVVPEYRTPNTDLASQEQIDNGTAQYNAGANAWEVPTQQTEKPIAIVPPATQQPPQTVEQPVVPPTTIPTTVAPVENTTVQPQAPVAPSTTTTPTETTVGASATSPDNIDVGGGYNPGSNGNNTIPVPTVVSSVNYVGSDGATYRQNTMSDGSTNTTKISEPTTSLPPVEDRTPTVVEKPSTIKAETLPEDQPPPTTPEPPYVPPIIPIVTPLDTTTTTTDNTRGHYTLGPEVTPNVPHTLNPGWITNVPQYYHPANQAGSQYYWGAHPYQTGTTFNPTLYNTLPNAPQTPFGLGFAQTSATPQQIIKAMGGIYPMLGTQGVTGPVTP